MKHFIPFDPDQPLLLPPDLREALPTGHPALLLVDLVEDLDFSEIYDAIPDARFGGKPGFDPRMMGLVWIYAYMLGMRSSRKVARALVENVAFRMLANNQTSREINDEHRAAEHAAAEAIQHAHRAGELLNEAKRAVAHGEWAAWLAEHFKGSARSAQRYMRVAKRWPEIEAKAPRMADLSLSTVEAMLAQPKAELPAARADTDDALESGLTLEDLSDLRAQLPSEGMLWCSFGNGSTKVDGTIVKGYVVCIGNPNPPKKYYAVIRVEENFSNGEYSSGFVRGDKRGVLFSYVPERLRKEGLPPIGHDLWNHFDSPAIGLAYKKFLYEGPSTPSWEYAEQGA